MLKKAFMLITLLTPVTGLLSTSSEADHVKTALGSGKNEIPTNHIQAQFEEFDDFDQAIEEAIDVGMLKSAPEMRQPSSAEVVARKAVAYVFMKYLWLREIIAQGCQQVKTLVLYLWLRIHG